jgi:hypothetical protein
LAYRAHAIGLWSEYSTVAQTSTSRSRATPSQDHSDLPNRPTYSALPRRSCPRPAPPWTTSPRPAA